MFDMLGSLTKAVVSVALTPVAAVVDTVMFIPDAEDSSKDAPFSRTGKLLKSACKNLENAVDPTDV